MTVFIKRFIKKIFRLLRVILHVLWGVVQALYYLDTKKLPGDREKLVIQRWYQRFVELMNINLRVHGELAKDNHLMVANHISWKDIVLLSSLYPTCFVAKSEISRWPLVGWMSVRTGTLFIKRGSISDVRRLNERIAQLLCDGERVTVFPEGATGEGDEIAHLYPGMFQAVVDIEDSITIGVQPVVIIYKVDGRLSPDIPYTGDTHLLKNLWAILGFHKITADVYFTPPVLVSRSNRKELAQQTYSQMQAVLDKYL